MHSRLDFGLGHSGTQLAEAVVKTGPVAEITAEIALIRHLGDKVCPRILGVWHGGYAMEKLQAVPIHELSLKPVVRLLEQRVWCRSGREQPNWSQHFHDRFGFIPPGWLSEFVRLVHGDPTAANVVWRENEVEPILLDPKPVGRGIPSFRSVDRGKILQSLMGWEAARYIGATLSDNGWPFNDLDDDELRRAIFWCGIHFMRIRQREGDTALGYWARDNARLLGDLVEVRMVC